MAPEFTVLCCLSPGAVTRLVWLLNVDVVVEGGLVGVATRFCSMDDKVGSANPPAGIVDVAPPVALNEGFVSDLIMENKKRHIHTFHLTCHRSMKALYS